MQSTLKAIALTTLSTCSLLPILASVTSQSAVAAQASTTFQTRVIVAANCTISATTLDFGTYDPLSSTVKSGTSTVAIKCTQGAVARIGLNTGSNANGSIRRMSNGAATPSFLSYELYKPNTTTPGVTPTKGSVWGNAFGSTSLDPGAAPSTAERSYTVFGEIPALQDVPAGTYTDTVTATVDF